MIRPSNPSNLLPGNPPLSLEEYAAQIAAERARSSVTRAADHQREDPWFDGMLADPVDDEQAEAPVDDERGEMNHGRGMMPRRPMRPMGGPPQPRGPAWAAALDTMAGGYGGGR